MYETQYKRSPGNNELLDKISYADLSQLKNMLRHLSMFEEADNMISLCVLTDIKSALGIYEGKKDNRVLTKKQRYAIIQHLIEDRTQSDVGIDMNITQQGVSLLINSGLIRMQKCLAKKEIKWTPWTTREKLIVLNYYPKIGPWETSKLVHKDKDKVISMYHALTRPKCSINTY